MSATKLKEKRDEEEAEDYYPDDFEDDSEGDEVNATSIKQIKYLLRDVTLWLLD